jgi:hypothetical protein
VDLERRVLNQEQPAKLPLTPQRRIPVIVHLVVPPSFEGIRGRLIGSLVVGGEK